MLTTILANFSSASTSASRTCWAYGTWEVLPSLYRGRVPKRDVTEPDPRNPTFKSVTHYPNVESYGRKRSNQL